MPIVFNHARFFARATKCFLAPWAVPAAGMYETFLEIDWFGARAAGV
jgi:hypothetical protein